jgi:hypothetical protein
MKYILQILSPAAIAAKSHPRWLIEEYARIFRIEVWLSPPKEPISTERIIMNEKKVFSVNE